MARGTFGGMPTVDDRTPVPPLEAYRADAARVSGLERQGTAAWVLLANVLWRIAQLPERARAAALRETASAAAAARAGQEGMELGGGCCTATSPQQPDDASRDVHEDADAALACLATQFWPAVDSCGPRAANALSSGHAVPREHANTAADGPLPAALALRAAELFERRGAFALAESLLVATDRVLGSRGSLTSARVAVQRGRIARQCADFAGADVHYRAAMSAGRRAGDAELHGRALLGLAAVANMRGNYPEARRRYSRALRIGTTAGLRVIEDGARQGLFAAAIAAGDLNAALQHGWAVFGDTTTDCNRQAEVLGMLGQLALSCDCAPAALRAYQTSVAWSTDLRIRLLGLGGAASAAARLEAADIVDMLRPEIDAAVSVSPHKFENAFVILELAVAEAALGREETAIAYARRAAALAMDGHFFEVEHRATSLLDALSLAARGTRQRSVVHAAPARPIRTGAESTWHPHAPQPGRGASTATGAGGPGPTRTLSRRAARVLRSLATLDASPRERATR